jgi:hypothetical protein
MHGLGKAGARTIELHRELNQVKGNLFFIAQVKVGHLPIGRSALQSYAKNGD